MTSRAIVIADTFNEFVVSSRITTFEVYAPRFLLAELNTHRVLARSAASSRAIPVKKRVEMVRDDPYIPTTFGKNKPGMSSDEDLTGEEAEVAENIWRGALTAALFNAELLAQNNVHKQLANRILEPFAHFHGVVTATEWDNFYSLRLSEAAQPEFKELAAAMQTAMEDSKPKCAKWTSNWHLPYNPDYGCDLMVALNICSARCARISYKSFDGKLSLAADDLKLCERLILEGHMSPFDHCAMADTLYQVPTGERYWCLPEDHRQYWGFVPYRVQIEHGLGVTCRRSSFAPLPRELVTYE